KPRCIPSAASDNEADPVRSAARSDNSQTLLGRSHEQPKGQRMTLRADHVAGAAFIVLGALIIALSGDLPFGNLAMPGAGFMPILIAVLSMILGAVLLLRARESAPFAAISWSDGKHAAMVVVIAAAAVALYETLGFAITMTLMMMG